MGGGAFCRLVEGLAFTIATPDCWTKSCSSMVPDAGLPAWWGRFPLGVPFARSKGTKTRLGRSPLSTPLGYEAVPASSVSSALAPVGSHR